MFDLQLLPQRAKPASADLSLRQILPVAGMLRNQGKKQTLHETALSARGCLVVSTV